MLRRAHRRRCRQPAHPGRCHGAYPTGCAGCYAADEAHLIDYLRAAKAGDEQRYLDEVVFGSRRQTDLARVAA